MSSPKTSGAMITIQDPLRILDLWRGEGRQRINTRLSGYTRPDIELLILSGLLGRCDALKKTVVVLPDEKHFFAWQGFMEQAKLHLQKHHSSLKVAQLPALKLWGSDRLVNQVPFVAQRLDALTALDGTGPALVLVTLQGLAQSTMTKDVFRKASIRIKKNEEWGIDDIEQNLQALGYLARNTVEEEGQFAIRGGVLDVFPANYELPIRIEFFGDQVLAFRHFSLDSQRSTEEINEVFIVPAMEALFHPEEKDVQAQRIYDYLIQKDADATSRDGLIRSFLNGYRFAEIHQFAPFLRLSSEPTYHYLTDQHALIFPEGIDVCIEALQEFERDSAAQYKIDIATHKPAVEPTMLYAVSDTASDFILAQPKILEFGNPIARPNEDLVSLAAITDHQMPALRHKQDLFDKWVAYLAQLLAEQKTVVFLASQQEHAKRIVSLFEHRGMTIAVKRDFAPFVLDPAAVPPGAFIVEGELSGPAWLNDGKILVLPEFLLFDKPANRRKSSSRKLKNYISSFRELKAGALVVHIDHGIGRYLGMSAIETSGARVDCLLLEYAGGDRVYVPVDRLRLLQRYSTGGDHTQGTAALDKLKGLGWQKRKGSVRKAVKDMADALLKIQAQRQLSQGLQFHGAPDDYARFEAEFPYIETEDQLRAIADVNADMEKSRPMDRLVCGDVGFGKTEVALRAAYRAVLEGYQVLVLVPTTVLCYQHYRTFQSRLEKHGVRVAQVNRFVKSKDLKAAMTGLETGKVDIMIGTHRLLSKDIKVKSLGLLVIDEEQRFGVSHKERLKEFRAGCHVLTLTATPIPRTLHMAMLGLRDISIVATPPSDRLAVKTYISRFEESLLTDAIRNEVGRGGQVFFVHNKVEDIVELRNKIRSFMPGIDVRVAHGQMSEDKLEKVIVEFLENKFPVLLCTTIIESGIDMPNVNTLIVNNAQQFGLAQLYQIRGRVGRSTRQAYAYFLVPPEERLSEESKQRLEVLSAHQELGAGFQIARYDLEIRGAGNLLGGEQSGRVDEVGIDLYTEMLEQAINEIKGQQVQERIDTEIKISFSALIPTSFIPEEELRLDLYKRLFSVEDNEDLVQLRAEIKDRFGPVPTDMELLLGVARLKWMLRVMGAQSLARSQYNASEIKFASLSAEQIEKVSKVVTENSRVYRLTPDFKLVLHIDADWGTAFDTQLLYLDELLRKLEPFVNELEKCENPS